MGGERKKAEKARLRKGVAVVVATPGRVMDHLESTAAFRLERCGLLVLDEADRLLDLGFQKTLAVILTALEQRAAAPGARLTALLSATLSAGIAPAAPRCATRSRCAGAAALPAPPRRRRRRCRPEAKAAPGRPRRGGGGRRRRRRRREQVLGRSRRGASWSRGAVAAAAELRGAPAQAAAHRAARFPALARRGRGRRQARRGGRRRRRRRWGRRRWPSWWSSSSYGVDFHFDLLGGGSERGGLAEAARGQGRRRPRARQRGRARRGCCCGGGGGGGGGDDGRRAAVGGRWSRRRWARGCCGCTAAGGSSSAPPPSGLRAAASGVLLCTDVAARGLNLQGVPWIVQYDLPSDPKEYVHRVGRAARLGQQGAALILLHPSEAPFLQLLQAKGMQLKELSFGSLQAALCPGGSTRDIYLLELALQKLLEERVKHAPYLHAAAAAAFQAYVRAYSAHSKAVQRVLHASCTSAISPRAKLRETPTAVAKQHTKRQRRRSPRRRRQAQAGLALSERLQQRQKTAMPIGASPSSLLDREYSWRKWLRGMF